MSMTDPCVVIEVGRKVVSIPLNRLWELRAEQEAEELYRIVLFSERKGFQLYMGRDKDLARIMYKTLKLKFLEAMKGVKQSPLVIHMGDLEKDQSPQ